MLMLHLARLKVLSSKNPCLTVFPYVHQSLSGLKYSPPARFAQSFVEIRAAFFLLRHYSNCHNRKIIPTQDRE